MFAIPGLFLYFYYHEYIIYGSDIVETSSLPVLWFISQYGFDFCHFIFLQGDALCHLIQSFLHHLLLM